MFLQSCFHSLVPLYEGTRRKMLSVPGEGGRCCSGPARRLFNDGVCVKVVRGMGGLEIWDVFLGPSGQIDPARAPR